MVGTGKIAVSQASRIFYGVVQKRRMACETSTLKIGGGRIERLEEEGVEAA